jgi:hypothetical protein
MMHIKIEWFDGKYPSFSLGLCSTEDSEPFLTVRGCSLKFGTDGGEFISFPAKKNEQTGLWWKHVTASNKFQEAVIAKAHASQPKVKAQDRGRIEDMDSDLPF